MKRWRIVRTESFLQLTAIGAPFFVAPLASTAFQLGFLVERWQDYVWDPPSIVAGLLSVVFFAIPALVVGPMVGFLPGLVTGSIVLLLSRVRPPSFIEVAMVGALVSGGFGWLLSGAAGGDAPRFAAFFAGSGLVAAWVTATIARRRGIVVPAGDPVEARVEPPGTYGLLEPRHVERPWALVRLTALWTPLAAGMIGVLLLIVWRWEAFGLGRAEALLSLIAFGPQGALVFGALPGVAVAIIVLLFEERQRPLSVVQMALVGALICAFAAWLPAHWDGRGGLDWVSPLQGAMGGLVASILAGLLAIRLRILGPPLPLGR